MQKESAAAQEERRKITERISIAMRSVFDSCRTKPTKTKWLVQKWQQNFRMHRKQVTAASRRCRNRLSPWERIEWRLCSEESEENESFAGADVRKRRSKKEH